MSQVTAKLHRLQIIQNVWLNYSSDNLIDGLSFAVKVNYYNL